MSQLISLLHQVNFQVHKSQFLRGILTYPLYIVSSKYCCILLLKKYNKLKEKGSFSSEVIQAFTRIKFLSLIKKWKP